MRPLALIINSDTVSTNKISYVLENQGFEVISCANGLEGLQSLSNTSPDIIICAYNLSLISGIEVIKTAKNIKRLENVPFVFTAESPTQDAMITANSLGADAFIYQPVASCNLIYIIKKYVPTQVLEYA
jgi:DNA-binding response OmpR family regulator